MRAGRSVLAAFLCAALLSACAGGNRAPLPPGVQVTRKPHYSGTLSDLASAVTTDTLLRHKGRAKLLQAVPYPACPGEAGLQRFRLSGPGRGRLLEIAFTQWNGTAVTASYQRAEGAPEDPAAARALEQAVCSSPVGG